MTQTAGVMYVNIASFRGGYLVHSRVTLDVFLVVCVCVCV